MANSALNFIGIILIMMEMSVWMLAFMLYLRVLDRDNLITSYYTTMILYTLYVLNFMVSIFTTKIGWIFLIPFILFFKGFSTSIKERPYVIRKEFAYNEGISGNIEVFIKRRNSNYFINTSNGKRIPYKEVRG